jgi:NTE family protein
MTPEVPGPLRADLVCEGGGVKGIGLVGAVTALAEAGYAFPRVAGSSAGAVVACLAAALQQAGEPLSRLTDVMRAVDYRRLRDVGALGRIPLVGRGLALLVHDGLYEGAYLERFLTGVLTDLGVVHFGDLRISPADDAALGMPAGGEYRLVVTVSDLSRQRLARLPWDLPSYDASPDDYPVARAVRASAAIPLFFRPVVQPTRSGEATWVDGGLLSNFPIGLFDRADTTEPRWPTFGVRLTTRPATPPVTRPVEGPVDIALAALDTLLTDQGSSYLEDPCTVRRTVFVPTAGTSVVDFDLDEATQERLYAAGRAAASEFLQEWDFGAYVRQCRRQGAGPAVARRPAGP